MSDCKCDYMQDTIDDLKEEKAELEDRVEALVDALDDIYRLAKGAL